MIRRPPGSARSDTRVPCTTIFRARVLARRTVYAGEPRAVDATQPPSRQGLAVPGVECRSTWLDLPARNPVQALATARVLVTEHVAGPVDTLHLAIAPVADDGSRQEIGRASCRERVGPYG